MDTFCYERQHGADMEVGSYAHRAILHEPEDIPSIEQAKLSPTEMPFTSDDFDPQLEQAYELMPELLGAEGAEMRYAINGLLSLTCDGNPILGESLVKGLWTAAAVWIKEGPGVGRALAEWMTHGHSEIDVHHSDIARFHPHQMRREHTRLRTTEAFIKTYGIVHPAEQYESDRDQRLSPMHASQQKLGAMFFETAGWERPHWYESNAGLLEEYGDAVLPREHEWDARWWSPIINAEHLRMREAAGVIDLSAFQVFDITGPGALDTVQRTCVAQCDVAVGKVIYTPVLDAKGGFLSDLTVMRLGDDHFRVVTGGAHGRADLQWFGSQLPDDGATTITDHTDAVSTIGLWGPQGARHPRLPDLRRRLRRGLRLPDLPRDHRRRHHGARLPDLLRRRARLGALRRDGRRRRAVGALLEAGAGHGAVPVGIGVYGTTGRIEKGYRAFGYELDAERSIVEAGMQRPKVKAADFVGREAYLAQREGAGAVRAVHPRRRRPHLGVGHEALHARRRADPDPRRRAAHRRARPPPLRHVRRLGAVARQAPAARLPAAGRGLDRQPAGRLLHGGALPGDRRLGRRHRAPRPRQRRASADDDLTVLVCIKRVVDSSSEVVLTDDGQGVDGRYAGFTMSAHEECAVELAVQIAAATGGTATVLTLGDADAVEQLRSALAVGCTAAVHVVADPQTFGPADVAREIAARRDGSHDLVLLGNDAADSGDFQVGIRLAYELGRPVVNGVSTVSWSTARRAS